MLMRGNEMKLVQVPLSCYNGEIYIEEKNYSIMNQKDVKVKLLMIIPAKF